MYRLALDHKARQIVLIAGILLAASLLALVLHRSASAQDNTIEFPENSKNPVATFTAEDPEGATPIEWFIAAAGTAHGSLEIADAADAEDFDIDKKTGDLTFDVGGDGDPDTTSAAPDYENPSGEGGTTSNTYRVVVGACDLALATDGTCEGNASYHKIVAKVMNLDEQGTVSLAATAGVTTGTPQYLVGTTLTATAKDGDITAATQTFTADVADEVNGVTWRWYRGTTEIKDESGNTYTLATADAGNHIRAVAFYVVAGNVDQETAEKTTEYPVLAARVGTNKLKFDPATVSMTISEGAKDRNVGAPVTATGNHGTIRYSLDDTAGDALAASPKFKIDKKTGQISTAVKLDYEAAAGDAANCATRNSCSVTVIATDSTGDTTTGTSPNLRATVTIKITNVDETPTFSTGAEAIKVPENSKALWDDTDTDNYNQATEAAVTYTAADPEGRTVSYSLAGPDRSKFQLSGRPAVLSFVKGADFEAKASADRDNVYEVTVQAAVGSDTGKREVRVTVGNMNEGPEVSGPSTRNFPENNKTAVATFTATDPEGATTIEWFIAAAGTAHGSLAVTDAADAEDFDIDKESGALTFDVGGDADDPDASVAPDFENPSGEGATSNTYRVVVGACDLELDSGGACPTGGNSSFHKIVVKVTNLDERGTVSLAATAGVTTGTPQYLVGTTLTATAKDGDITAATQTFTADVADEVDGVTWRWDRGGSPITGATTNEYILADADANKRIRVVVTYQVDGKTSRESASETTEYTVLAARVGANALKFDPATVSMSIMEGAKDRNVGAPVTATGNHGTIRYSLDDTAGDALAASPKFKIDKKTGQISTAVKLDYEAAAGDAANCATRNSCSVTVIATDSTGDTTTGTSPNVRATVTIKITNVDEKPTFSTGAETVSVPENSAVLHGDTTAGYSVATTDIAAANGVTYTAADPEGRTVTYSLAGPDASKFQLKDSPPVLSFVSKPDFEAKASADRDNVYEVTVRATVGSHIGERKVRVTVANVNEAPEITARPATGLTVTGPTSRNYPENGSDSVGTYTAAGPNAASARWTLSGTDAGAFRVSSRTGMTTMLRFASTPDYENPTDSNNDRVYMVTLTATSGDDTGTRTVTVTVTDVDETGTGSQSIADRYDANNNNVTEKSEVLAAINDYLDGGAGAPTKVDVISLINRYLDS